MDNIPIQYQQYWKPFKTADTLYHLTTASNIEDIQAHGLLPRDPNPKHWKGMRAIFMAYPKDPLYIETQKNVLAHVKEKGEELIRLHIKTNNNLYKSTDPERTFQVISLDPIPARDIIRYELVTP